MNEPVETKTKSKVTGLHPFRRAVLRGMGVVLPPLLTILVFLWAWNMIEHYALVPFEKLANYVTVRFTHDIRQQVPTDLPVSDVIRVDNRIVKFRDGGQTYVQVPRGQWIPEKVYDAVLLTPGEMPKDGIGFYERYVDAEILKRRYVVPAFLSVFILILYGAGKLMAAGVGRILWNSFESLIHRLPVIRNVYSSVKQVTDFVFSDQEIEFNRIVAVEYPRKGIWSIGFVTGESMLDIRSAANQPVLSVLIPTSPAPMTGFTITVLKSETVDLNITLDQAIQFVVSCGVVIPPQQQQRVQRINAKITSAIAVLESSRNGDPGNGQLPTAGAGDELKSSTGITEARVPDSSDSAGKESSSS